MKPSDKIMNELNVRLRKKDAYALLVGTFLAVLLVPAVSYMFISLAQVPFMGITEVSVVSVVICCVSLVLSVLAIVFLSPVFMGYKRIAFLTAYGKDATAKDLFYYFYGDKMYAKTIKYYLSVFVRKLPLLLPLFALCACLFLIDGYRDYYKSQFNIGDFVFAVLPYVKWIVLVLSAIIYLPYSMRYFCAPYLFMLNRYSVKECIQISVFISKQKGYKSNILKTAVKLVPYYLLCIPVVPCIFCVPKIRTAYAVCEKWMIALYKDEYGKSLHDSNQIKVDTP